jgi:hypothetical protein
VFSAGISKATAARTASAAADAREAAIPPSSSSPVALAWGVFWSGGALSLLASLTSSWFGIGSGASGPSSPETSASEIAGTGEAPGASSAACAAKSGGAGALVSTAGAGSAWVSSEAAVSPDGKLAKAALATLGAWFNAAPRGASADDLALDRFPRVEERFAGDESLVCGEGKVIQIVIETTVPELVADEGGVAACDGAGVGFVLVGAAPLDRETSMTDSRVSSTRTATAGPLEEVGAA